MKLVNSAAFGRILWLLPFFFWCNSRLFSQTTWNGNTSTDWADGTNWSAGVPTVADDATIPDVTNDPVIGTAAFAKSVTIASGGMLTIQSGSSLTMNGSATQGILNQGTVENSGTISIGASTSTGAYGIRNEAIFNNNPAGVIHIDRTNLAGIYNAAGTFTNAATINVGAAATVNNEGILNAATFNNDAGSAINIDRCTGFGISMNLPIALFNNSGVIHLGDNLASNFVQGLNMSGNSQFYNYSTGTIEINRFSYHGITVQGAYTLFTNEGMVAVGNIANTGWDGIVVQDDAKFINAASGVVTIDRTSYDGLVLQNSARFTNNGSLKVGNLAPIGSTCILVANFSQFTNGATGTIESNNSTTTDGLWIVSDAKVNNYGSFKIGNLSPLNSRGIVASYKSEFNNFAGAYLEVNNAKTTQAIALYNAGTKFTNSGSIQIGNLSQIAWTGIEMFTGSKFYNNQSGSLEINNTKDFDGIVTRDPNTLFSNAGNIKIGNLSSIKKDGIEVVTQSKFENTSTGSIEINRTGRNGCFVESSGSEFKNEGAITIGNVASITKHGIEVLSGGNFLNSASGTIAVNNITYYGLVASGATVINNGSLTVGNLGPISNNGMSIENSAVFTNGAMGSVECNNVINYDGLAVFYGAKINNYGSFRIGNLSPVNSRCIVAYGGGEFNNLAGAYLEANNAKNYQAIALYHGGTKVTNSGSIQIGNLTQINTDGITLSSGSTFHNNQDGILQINNTKYYSGIWMENLNTLFSNAGNIKIGNLFNIGRDGIAVLSQSKFENTSTGSIEINRTGRNGCFVESAGSELKNEGAITIGNVAPITTHGIELVSSGKLINSATATLDINNVVGYFGMVANSATILNHGSLKIGNLGPISWNCIQVQNSSVFTNGVTGIIESNNTTNYDGIVMVTGSKFDNQGSLKVGNLSPLNWKCLVVTDGSKFNNFAGAYLELNNAKNYQALAMYAAGTKLTNSGNIQIGNLSQIAWTGIELNTGSKLYNNIDGSIQVNNTRDYDGITTFDLNTLFSNAGNLKIGNLSNIRKDGIEVLRQSIFENTSTGTIEIDRTGRNGCYVESVGSEFRNEGSLTIGKNALITNHGAEVRSGAKFFNLANATLEINRTNVYGIKLLNTGSSFTNLGKIYLGNVAPIRLEGIDLSTGSLFENKQGATIEIDSTQLTDGIWSSQSSFVNAGMLRIGKTYALGTSGRGIVLLSTSTFTNQPTGVVEIDRINTRKAIEFSSGNTFNNQGVLNIGLSSMVRTGIGHSSTLSGIFNNTGVISFGDILLDGIADKQVINNNAGGVISVPATGKLQIATLAVLNNNATATVNNLGVVTNKGLINSTGSFNNNGIYTGTGSFGMSLFDNPAVGIVAPGLPVGCTSFTNGWQSIGKLEIAINGTTACTTHDRLNVTGTATVGGDLYVQFGYAPACGQTYQIIQATAYNGAFSNIIVSPNTITVSYSNGILTILDVTAPMITCPSDIVQSNDPTLCSAVVTYSTPAGTDNCPGQFTMQSTGMSSGSIFPVGLTMNTFLVTDGSGNTASCAFNVTVNDTEQPAATAPTTISVNCGSTPAGATNYADFVILGGTASDNCTSTAALGISFADGPLIGNSCGSTISRTYTVSDASTNSKTVTQTITVLPAQLPTILAADNLTITCLTALPNPSSRPYSNGLTGGCLIDGLSSMSTFTTLSPGSCSGSVLETWSATDPCGRPLASVSRTILVLDNVAPTALCKNLTLLLNSSGNATTNATAINNNSTDNCGSIQSLSLSKTTFNCSNYGPNTVTLTVTDNCLNTAICTAIVTVNYTSAPVAKCRGAVVVLSSAGNGSISSGGINNGSTDVCSGNGLNLSLSKTTFNCSNLGVNTVVLTVTNIAGSSGTCSAIITVKDLTKPVAKCKSASYTLASGGTITVPTSAINDGCTDACTNPPILTLNPNTFTCANVGSNPVTLTVKDASNNTSTCAATVTIICGGSSPSSQVVPTAIADYVESIDIFPNPATDEVRIRLNDAALEDRTITLTDNTGKLLLNQVVTKGDHQATINFLEHRLGSGIYMVTIRFKESVQTRQLVIFRE